MKTGTVEGTGQAEKGILVPAVQKGKDIAHTTDVGNHGACATKPWDMRRRRNLITLLRFSSKSLFPACSGIQAQRVGDASGPDAYPPFKKGRRSNRYSEQTTANIVPPFITILASFNDPSLDYASEDPIHAGSLVTRPFTISPDVLQGRAGAHSGERALIQALRGSISCPRQRSFIVSNSHTVLRTSISRTERFETLARP